MHSWHCDRGYWSFSLAAVLSMQRVRYQPREWCPPCRNRKPSLRACNSMASLCSRKHPGKSKCLQPSTIQATGIYHETPRLKTSGNDHAASKSSACRIRNERSVANSPQPRKQNETYVCNRQHNQHEPSISVAACDQTFAYNLVLGIDAV
jgi:hypothetical protein